MKGTNDPEPAPQPEQTQPKKARLTAANLQKNEDIISASEKDQNRESAKLAMPKPSSAKKGAKPLWAKTKEELVNEEEEEIDDLIDFAYDLDYEKYIEDLEVRQALALIKDRVDEIKQDVKWKQKLQTQEE